MTRLTAQQITEAAPEGWSYLLDALVTRIATKDFGSGLALVDAIGSAAEAANHHPDLDLRYGHVEVRLRSHDEGGVTDRDVTLARTITALAAEAGLSPSRAGLSRIELGLDTPAFERVLPFWQVVLGMTRAEGPDVGDELRDPAGQLPTIWFQRSGDEEPRQRGHADVWLHPEDVQPRIDAALAAGGTLVSDAEAPSFWVLADPEGNRMCLCTWQERS